MTRFVEQLKITELFHSLQGESVHAGLPTVFIRLTGCPLRCAYCDTSYAFSGGILTSLNDILTEVASYQCKQVCVTGGEPLAQPACTSLLRRLCDDGYSVSIETSGALDIAPIDQRVMIVMDLKTPDSLESGKNRLANLSSLKPTDQIKFVLCSRKDYEWACSMIDEHELDRRVQLLFSPSWDQLNPTELASWILADKLPVRFQIQLHKVLWGTVAGH